MSLSKQKETRISNVERMMKSCSVQKPLNVSKDPYWHSTISLLGLGFEAYDREGNPKPNSLMSHALFSRIFAFKQPYDDLGNTFLDWSSLTDQDLYFQSATKLIVFRPMYDISISKSFFDFKNSLGFVGNSSLALVTDVFVPDQAEPIFQQLNQLVCIDRATRRPKTIPDWFKDKYTGKGVLEKGVIVKSLEKPTSTFVYKVKIGWSDTDFYKHTNYASYVRFAVDAVHQALLDVEKSDAVSAVEGTTTGTDLLKGLTNEIVRNGVKSVDVCYLKESLEGQQLDIHIWQEEGQTYVVKCVIESNNVDVCHMTMEYFE